MIDKIFNVDIDHKGEVVVTEYKVLKETEKTLTIKRGTFEVRKSKNTLNIVSSWEGVYSENLKKALMALYDSKIIRKTNIEKELEITNIATKNILDLIDKVVE